MTKKLIAANWKENPRTEAQALKLFRATVKIKRGTGVEVAICPPFVYLEEVSREFKKLANKNNLSLGAQDVFWEDQGPFTGEVGAAMLRSLGTRYVIVGHSERRKWMHETDEMINKKIGRVFAAGMTTILCVGEPLSVRSKGLAAARAFVKSQLKKDLERIKKLKPKPGRIVVAYEPIWSIGTGRYDEAEDAASMATYIKKTIKGLHGISNVQVLYGGSVNSANIFDYVQYKEIDGALVGGASLKAEEFKKLIINTSRK